MICSLNASPGDCCYFLTQSDKKIKFGVIKKTIPDESAILVMEVNEARYNVVWEKNAAWKESELKGKKWLKPHNYKRNTEASNE